MNEILKEALRYLKLGYSVIPLHYQSKIPAIRWEEWQHKRADVAQISHWFSIKRNIAIITGAISKLVVIDIDENRGGVTKEILDRFPTEMISKTAKGYHLFYNHPGWVVDNAVDLLPGVDVRGDGGYVVAPPSVHPDGHIYSWVHDSRIISDSAIHNGA